MKFGYQNPIVDHWDTASQTFPLPPQHGSAINHACAAMNNQLVLANLFGKRISGVPIKVQLSTYIFLKPIRNFYSTDLPA